MAAIALSRVTLLVLLGISLTMASANHVAPPVGALEELHATTVQPTPAKTSPSVASEERKQPDEDISTPELPALVDQIDFNLPSTSLSPSEPSLDLLIQLTQPGYTTHLTHDAIHRQARGVTQRVTPDVTGAEVGQGDFITIRNSELYMLEQILKEKFDPIPSGDPSFVRVYLSSQQLKHMNSLKPEDVQRLIPESVEKRKGQYVEIKRDRLAGLQAVVQEELYPLHEDLSRPNYDKSTVKVFLSANALKKLDILKPDPNNIQTARNNSQKDVTNLSVIQKFFNMVPTLTKNPDGNVPEHYSLYDRFFNRNKQESVAIKDQPVNHQQSQSTNYGHVFNKDKPTSPKVPEDHDGKYLLIQSASVPSLESLLQKSLVTVQHDDKDASVSRVWLSNEDLLRLNIRERQFQSNTQDHHSYNHQQPNHARQGQTDDITRPNHQNNDHKPYNHHAHEYQNDPGRQNVVGKGDKQSFFDKFAAIKDKFSTTQSTTIRTTSTRTTTRVSTRFETDTFVETSTRFTTHTQTATATLRPSTVVATVTVTVTVGSQGGGDHGGPLYTAIEIRPVTRPVVYNPKPTEHYPHHTHYPPPQRPNYPPTSTYYPPQPPPFNPPYNPPPQYPPPQYPPPQYPPPQYPPPQYPPPQQPQPPPHYHHYHGQSGPVQGGQHYQHHGHQGKPEHPNKFLDPNDPVEPDRSRSDPTLLRPDSPNGAHDPEYPNHPDEVNQPNNPPLYKGQPQELGRMVYRVPKQEAEKKSLFTFRVPYFTY